MPSQHLQIPDALLRAPNIAPATKAALFVADACGRGAWSHATVDKLAERARVTPRAMRKYLGQLAELRYVERVQKDHRRWSTHMINRVPAAWLPHWAVAWWNSSLCPTVEGKPLPQILVIWAYLIRKLPSRELVLSSRRVSPWCEVPIRELARVAGIKRFYVPELLRLMAEVGLIIMVDRGDGATPAVYPQHYGWTWDERVEHVTCMVEMLAERDLRPEMGIASQMWQETIEAGGDPSAYSAQLREHGVHGHDSPTVYDDRTLAAYVRRSTRNRRQQQTPEGAYA